MSCLRSSLWNISVHYLAALSIGYVWKLNPRGPGNWTMLKSWKIFFSDVSLVWSCGALTPVTRMKWRPSLARDQDSFLTSTWKTQQIYMVTLLLCRVNTKFNYVFLKAKYMKASLMKFKNCFLSWFFYAYDNRVSHKHGIVAVKIHSIEAKKILVWKCNILDFYL